MTDPIHPPLDADPRYPDPVPRILQTSTINLLGGSSGIGKTTLTASLARSFRDGTPIFGHALSGPREVGYITTDRPWRSSYQWFSTAGFPEVRQYSILDTRASSDPRAISSKRLRDKRLRTQIFCECVEHLGLPDGGVLFVDALATFLGGNLNDYDTVNVACVEIHRYLLDRHICLIGLMHGSKQKGDPKDRYLSVFDWLLGSSALLGFTNTQMQLIGPDQSESGLHEFHWNPHHHPRERFLLRRDAHTGLFIPAGDEAGPAPVRAPIPPHCQNLYDAFTDTPLAVTQVFARFPDASRPTVFRWLKALVDLGYIVSPAHGVYQKAGESRSSE